MADGVQVSDSMNEPLLVLSDVRFGFANRREFLGPVGLEVRAGECWAIVGPNGAGKSTLLRLMAGLVRPTGGRILLAQSSTNQSPKREREVHSISRIVETEASPSLLPSTQRGEGSLKRHGFEVEKPVACAPGSDAGELRELKSTTHRDRARVLAYVPQQVRVEGELTAREVVLLGRYPHRGAGYFESEQDERVAGRAMALTETTAFAGRTIGTLSGGEAQRVHVAAALAQESRVLLLDEPTASLDLKHQLTMFDLLRDLTLGGCSHEIAPTSDGPPTAKLRLDRATRCVDLQSAVRGSSGELAVVVATHDLNLAARYCTHVLLLNDGRVAARGTPEKVIKPDVLEPVYGVRMVALSTRESEIRGESGAAAKQSWVVATDRMDVRST